MWRVQGGVPGERDPRATGTGGGLGAGAYMYRGPGVARGGAGWDAEEAHLVAKRHVLPHMHRAHGHGYACKWVEAQIFSLGRAFAGLAGGFEGDEATA